MSIEIYELPLQGFGTIAINSSVYDEGLYKIGRDFKISIGWNNQPIEIETVPLANESTIKVEEIYTRSKYYRNLQCCDSCLTNHSVLLRMQMG